MIRAASSLRSASTRGIGKLRGNGGSSARRPHQRNEILHPRSFSTSPVVLDDSENGAESLTSSSSPLLAPSPSFEDTMSKLFQQQEATNAASDAVFDPTWYNVADQAINALNLFHDTTGLSYGATIVTTTCIIRVFMFPLFVQAQRNSSRMAHMQPEMQALKAKVDAMGKNVDQETQTKMGLQMRALFRKYDCNPMRALMLPLIQAPVFMGMFFGLRKMPDYFTPELVEGGILWFTDLTAIDPLYVLPAASAITFLTTIELGKQQMTQSNPAQGQIMVNVFRAMAIVMVPVIANFSAALNLYWTTNNTITLLQSAAFQSRAMRKSLGIWDPPKPVPGMPQAKGIVESIQEVIERKPSEADQIKAHNEAVENKKRVDAITRGGKKPRTRRG